MVPVYGFPPVALSQWRCSAAKAAAHSLPRALEEAVPALHLSIEKDMDGSKVMKKLAKPRKARKKEIETWAKTGATPPTHLWHESLPLFERLWDYCKIDVLAEEGLSHALADLSESETAMFTMDQTINQRGFEIDRAAVDTALTLIAQETTRLNAELSVVTNGKVKKATQRAQMIEWFGENGLDLPNTQKATIDELLEMVVLPDADNMSDLCKRGLEIVRTLGRSSTAKYQAMQNWMDPHDDRVRGGLLFHGASTGRWSGSGVQPHNFVRGSVKDMDALWEGLKSGRMLVDARGAPVDLLAALSEGLRGAIVAKPGAKLFVADYAAIEARVVMWLADEHEALEIFRTGKDIYCELAAEVYGRVITKADKDERQLGKQGILGCGFGMGASKFLGTCEKYGIIITEETAQTVVDSYRRKYSRVRDLWHTQESAAIQAVVSKTPQEAGWVTWSREDPFLFCELPSGRRLAYPFPEVRQHATPWGEMRPQLTFMSVNAYTRKWTRGHTYGGSIVENITQAVARDVMADAMIRCENHGYPIVLSVHDELIAESATGSIGEFERLVAEVPDWCDGLPIAVEGFQTTRYRK
jgi:DNA polymerase